MNVCLLLIPEEWMEKCVNEVGVGDRVGAGEQGVQEQADVMLPTLGNLSDLLTAQVEATAFPQTERRLKNTLFLFQVAKIRFI